jgi:hypothetical protein
MNSADIDARPHVSIVTYFRNDGYTDDFALRVKRATECLVEQLGHAQIRSEVVLVEWNPPAERPLIVDYLHGLKDGGHVTVRAIVVDRKHHDPYLGSRERGMHAAEAANAGLRRARGHFITPKAADTFFSADTVAALAKPLEDEAIYRCDRFDIVVPTEIFNSRQGIELLRHLETLEGTRHTRLPQPQYWKIRDLHTNGCGDFILMSQALWHRVRGYPFDPTVLSLECDALLMHEAVAFGAREILLPSGCRVIKAVHQQLFGHRTTAVWRPWQARLDEFFRSRQWYRAQHLSRMYLDYPRRKVRGVESILGPSIERSLARPASEWARGVPPHPLGPENWGLGGVPLPERTLCCAGWDTALSAVAP